MKIQHKYVKDNLIKDGGLHQTSKSSNQGRIIIEYSVNIVWLFSKCPDWKDRKMVYSSSIVKAMLILDGNFIQGFTESLYI